MKKIILLFAIIICSNKGITQTTMTVYQMDSLTGEQFSQIVKKQFNAVINSSGKTTIGNYASADIKDGHLAFNATKNFKNGNMLSINANGGVTDGFFAIFNQNKINSNVGVDLKYNMMFKKSSALSFYIDEITKLKRHLNNADVEYNLGGVIYDHYSIMLQKKLVLVKIEIKTLTTQLGTKLTEQEKADLEYQLALKNLQQDSISLKLQTLKPKPEAVLGGVIYDHDSIMLQKKLDLINIEIKILTKQLGAKYTEQEKANLEYKLALKNLQQDSISLKLQTLKPKSEAVDDNKKKKKKDKLAEVDAFEFKAIRFQWISLGAGFQNNNFNQFKPTLTALDSQIVKLNYTTCNITAEWNLYNYNHYSKYTYYLLVGGKFSIDDNFSDLLKVELNDTHQYGDTVTKRTVTKKITAYKGDYKTKLIGGKFYLDFYKFFLVNAAALHIYPEVNYKQHSKPLYNIGIGLLYSFKDSKDKENKAKLNVELYFKLTDLPNNTNSELSVLQRNEWGLRLSIPVSFFNF